MILAVRALAVSSNWRPGEKEILEMGLWFWCEGIGVAGERIEKEGLV